MFQLKKIAILTPVFLLLLISSGSVANAQASQATDKATNPVKLVNAESDQLRTRAQSKIEERVSEDKKNYPKVLSALERQRIVGRCKPAQNVIVAYTKKVDNFETSRKKVYGNVTDRLNSLANKLTEMGYTEEALVVQAKQLEFQQKVDEVYASIDDFQQALVDLGEVNCTENPDAFQAVLDTSRSYRVAINEKTKAVREYYSQDLVKALSEIKSKLATAPAPTKEEN
ncbi:MAG: hypothetical protein M3Q79_02765 [bacterium]|nr:hypothetical protein [bacterium]